MHLNNKYHMWSWHIYSVSLNGESGIHVISHCSLHWLAAYISIISNAVFLPGSRCGCFPCFCRYWHWPTSPLHHVPPCLICPLISQRCSALAFIAHRDVQVRNPSLTELILQFVPGSSLTYTFSLQVYWQHYNIF